MAKNTELETNGNAAETSAQASTGAEQTNTNGAESSNQSNTGNFLTDLLKEPKVTSVKESTTKETKAAETENADTKKVTGEETAEGAETADEGDDDITFDTQGDEVTMGDVIKQNGEPILNGKVQMEDGTILVTDGEGKITDIIEGEKAEEGADIKDPFELKTGDEVEKFDLRKKEDLEKVREYAQKGRFFEKEQQAFKEKETALTVREEQFNTRETSMAYNLLYLQNQGKIQAEEFEERPYEDFVGSSEKRDKEGNVIEEATPEGDRRMWNNHKQAVANHNKVLQDYKDGFSRTSAGYRKIVSDFQAKHPEIKDMTKWINETLGKFAAPIVTFGKEEYHPDTLEMVHYWQNREKIEKDIREDERRKKAKVKIVKTGNKGADAASGNAVDNFISNITGSKYNRKITN